MKPAVRGLPRALLAIVALALTVSCGQKGPPRHPIQGISARIEAKLDIIDLVVDDPPRAERVRALYLEAWKLGRAFDLDRARALLEARSHMQARTTTEAQSEPGSSVVLERVLAPPLEVGQVAYQRYVELMLEARGLLTSAEFERLNDVR